VVVFVDADESLSPTIRKRLLHHHIEDAVFGGIVDRDAVAACESAGAGATVKLVIGGKIDSVFSRPYPIEW
jgi:microcystin degradation protein MlrC